MLSNDLLDVHQTYDRNELIILISIPTISSSHIISVYMLSCLPNGPLEVTKPP